MFQAGKRTYPRFVPGVLSLSSELVRRLYIKTVLTCPDLVNQAADGLLILVIARSRPAGRWTVALVFGGMTTVHSNLPCVTFQSETTSP